MTHLENGSPTVKTDRAGGRVDELPNRAAIREDGSVRSMGLFSAVAAIIAGVLFFIIAAVLVPACNGGFSTMWFGGGMLVIGLGVLTLPGPTKVTGGMVAIIGVAALVAGYFITHGAGCYVPT